MSEPRSGGAPPRLCDFPPAGRDAWEQRALRELAGAPLDSLHHGTRHGVVLGPMYSDGDGGSPSHRAALKIAPGQAPFLRGPTSAATHGWTIRQAIDACEPPDANADACADLARGVDSLWIRLDEPLQALDLSLCGDGDGDGDPSIAAARPGVILRDLDDLERLLAGVDLDRDLVIEVGAASLPITAGILTIARRRGIDPSSLRLTIGADPLAAMALRGHLRGGLDRAYAELATTMRHLAEVAPTSRSLLVTAIPYADAGAGADEEIALLLCALIEHLRRLGELGIGVELIAPRILGAMSVDRDLFVGIAKIRATRLLAARVLLACGAAPHDAALPLHVEGAWRELTAFDPWVNLLRGTTSAFVGAISGVESVATAPFTDGLGRADAEARRMASNTQLLLRAECHLGRVADPTGGSWYVESLTDELARAAWSKVQAIEAAGGLASAILSGAVQSSLAQAAATREEEVARATVPLTGVNRYAILRESAPEYIPRNAPTSTGKTPAQTPAQTPAHELQDLETVATSLEQGASFAAVRGGMEENEKEVAASPLRRRRLAQPLEELRRAGEVKAALLCLGELAAIKPRIDFIRALLASGGIAAQDAETLHNDASAAAEAYAQSPSPAAVIIAADADYPSLIPTLIPQLRSAGARIIAIAGRPKDPDTIASLERAGVDLFLRWGGDALAATRRLRSASIAGEEVGP